MRVVVTGAAGFIGRRLVMELLARGALRDGIGKAEQITELVAADLAAPANLPEDPRLRVIVGDVSTQNVLQKLITPQTRVIFHLAAVVSVAAENDFDLGMRVNLDGTRHMLELARHGGSVPRVLFASSAAVYGGALPATIVDGIALLPQTSYGMQKAVSEFLIADYSRKGFIDGRCLRLPTVAVRPGKPNMAASAFASSLVREPLEGRAFACPVPAQTHVCLISPGKVVESFIHASELAGSSWGMQRAVPLFGVTTTVAEMVAAIAQISPAAARRVTYEIDERIHRIVLGWPTRFDSAHARKLGFTPDASAEAIIQAFVAQDLGGKIAE